MGVMIRIFLVMLLLMHHAQAQLIDEAIDEPNDTEFSDDDILRFVFPNLEVFIGAGTGNVRFDYTDAASDTWRSAAAVPFYMNFGTRFKYIGFDTQVILADSKQSKANTAPAEYTIHYSNYGSITRHLLGFLPIYRNKETRARVELFASYGMGSYDMTYYQGVGPSISDAETRKYPFANEQGRIQSRSQGVQILFADKDANKTYWGIRIAHYQDKVTKAEFQKDHINYSNGYLEKVSGISINYQLYYGL